MTSTTVQPTSSSWVIPNIKFLLAGVYFGFILIKAEVVSWYRIQEMFRFQSFHMYGVIGSAIVVGALSLWLIKRFHLKSLNGETIQTNPKAANLHSLYCRRNPVWFGLGINGCLSWTHCSLIGSGLRYLSSGVAECGYRNLGAMVF